MRHDHILPIAVKCALQSCGKYAHGAVVVSGKRVVATGFNGPKMLDHAECVAIRRIARKNITRKRLTLYVVRTDPKGRLLNSEPCSTCSRLIKRSSNISLVFYSGSDGNLIRKKPFELEGAHVTTGAALVINTGFTETGTFLFMASRCGHFLKVVSQLKTEHER